MGAEQQSNLQAARDLLHRDIKIGPQGEAVGAELFGVYDTLSQNRRLLRALTDPGRTPVDRVNLAESVFSARVGSVTMAVISLLVGQHWGHQDQLGTTIRELGMDAYVLAEDYEKNPDLSQQLVDAYALIASNRDLRIQLSDLGEGDADQRAALAGKIFEGHVSPIAQKLIMRAAHDVRYGHLVQLLRRMAARASDMNGRALVVCSTARPLTEAQATRMASLAERKWGRPVDMAQVVDPSLIGGFRLDIGEESIDTSIRTDITMARLAMAK